NALPDGVVVRDVQVVELGAVVVTRQSSHLLEGFGLEFHDRRDAGAGRLLPTATQRLTELTADRFPAEQPEMSRPRGQTEQLVGPWRSQPLEIDRELGSVEILARRSRRDDVSRQPRGRRVRQRQS